MDQDNAIDEIDISPFVKDFVHNSTKSKRRGSKFCNNIKLSRSEVVFFVQIIVNFSLVKFCGIKHAFLCLSVKSHQYGYLLC